MTKTPLLTIVAATLLFGCQNRSEQTIGALKTTDSSLQTAIPTPAADKVHNSQNSIDWDGSYKGILPCAGCDGIETELVLKKT